MSVVISSSYVLADSVSGGGRITADNPLIGWRSIVGAATLSTTTEAPGHPASHLANPATHLRWQGLATPADEHIAVGNPDVADVDYIAIARHNLGRARIPVSVEILDGDDWVERIAPVLLPNDGPALFRFPRLAYAGIRLRLQPGLAAPTVAVVYCGDLLVLQRRLYVGHTPMPYGRALSVVNHRSVAGHFLGRIVLGKRTATQVALRNLTPDWYRAQFEPFMLAAQEVPFFFAWRPASYPNEIGYAWLAQDSVPRNQSPNGMMQIELALEGVV